MHNNFNLYANQSVHLKCLFTNNNCYTVATKTLIESLRWVIRKQDLDWRKKKFLEAPTNQ